MAKAEIQFGELGGGTPDLLWESTATSLTANTEITLSHNLENYDAILMECKSALNANVDELCAVMVSNLSAQKEVGYDVKVNAYVYSEYRLIQKTASNKLTFQTGNVFRASGSNTTGDTYCVPVNIWGIKF